MNTLKSIYLVACNIASDNKKLTGELSYHSKTNAIQVLSKGGILDGLGRIPIFYNGVRLKSRNDIITALNNETGKRTVTKIQYCTDVNQGFERCLAIQTFKNIKTFEESIYCRRYAAYTKEQHNKIENLIT